jgi:hypothetical protein
LPLNPNKHNYRHVPNHELSWPAQWGVSALLLVPACCCCCCCHYDWRPDLVSKLLLMPSHVCIRGWCLWYMLAAAAASTQTHNHFKP